MSGCGADSGQGDAAGSDCSEVLHRVYECGPCLQEYDLDQALKALVKRSCACEEAPVELRTQIMARITTIRYQISE